ncbi:hypothetical protein I4U23_004926 [Adineta vaga]|nr:hypothetical protein I4U23_004926 [Adineta vaga]
MASKLHSWTNENTVSQTKNVFGIDKQTPVTSKNYPWRAIGKLSTGCTGTLVGPNLVLTAAHCIIDPKTQALVNYAFFFYANMIDGNTNHQAWVSHAWWGSNYPGWLGVRKESVDTMKSTRGTLVGYSADFQQGKTAGVRVNCSLTKEAETDFYLHNCHMTRGASGGPIFAYRNNSPYI